MIFQKEVPQMNYWKNLMFSKEREQKLREKLSKKLEDKGLCLENKENINNLPQEIVNDITSEGATHFLENLKIRMPEILKKQNRNIKKPFEKRLNELWKEPFNLLDIFLIMSCEIGATFNKELRPTAAKDKDFVFEVLTRLHARACRTAGEVLTLMHSGYASGAHARWRTLHEIAVIEFFIKDHGDEVAERYLLHDRIESYKAMLQYQKYCNRLEGYKPFSEEEVNKAKKMRDDLCEKYGKSFGNPWGWASAALGKESPRFSDIEEATDLDHYHPFYKMASHPTHAGPKGIMFTLGLIPTEKEILLAGPSNAGMADPGHATAISLYLVNVALLLTRPSLQIFTVLKAMELLQNEIGTKFLEVHKTQLESEDLVDNIL